MGSRVSRMHAAHARAYATLDNQPRQERNMAKKQPAPAPKQQPTPKSKQTQRRSKRGQ